MVALFGAIAAFFSAFPVVQQLFEKFSVWYFENKKAEMKAENVAAIAKALLGDQRDVEKLLGSDVAGAPSGIPGTSIVSDIPGLPNNNP